MILQFGVLGLEVLMGVFILIFMMVLMLYFYLKVLILYFMVPIYLFSLVIGLSSIAVGDIPFTPYFQGFFLVFQSIVFIMGIIEIKKF